MKESKERCVLLLFNLFSAETFREAVVQTVAFFISGAIVDAIRYSSSTVLLVINLCSLQRLLNQVKEVRNEQRSKMNVQKTEFMLISKNKTKTKKQKQSAQEMQLKILNESMECADKDKCLEP